MSHLRTNKRARTHTFDITLIDSAFRSLIDVTTRSMKDCASFNPLGDDPVALRTKYLPLYARLVELISEEHADKEQKNTDVAMSYGVAITNFNFTHGHVSYEFRRTIAGVEWKYIINFTNEDVNYVTIATKDKSESESKSIRYKFAFI